jgi:hypothetical protein
MRDSFHWDPRRPTRHAYVHFRMSGPSVDGSAMPVVRELAGRPDPSGALCHYLLWLGSTRPPSWRRHARETLRLLALTFLGAPEPTDAHGPDDVLPPAVVAAMGTGRRAGTAAAGAG